MAVSVFVSQQDISKNYIYITFTLSGNLGVGLLMK